MSNITISGKISPRPHTTLCIQFLDKENNNKNSTLPLGKQICFYNSMGLRGNYTLFHPLTYEAWATTKNEENFSAVKKEKVFYLHAARGSLC